MKRSVIVGVVICILVSWTVTATETKQIIIITPKDGSILNNHLVNITGTALGIDEEWFQSNDTDFNNGTTDNTTIISPGDLMIEGGIYDDFSANNINLLKWSVIEFGGMTSIINNSKYSTFGSSTSQNPWGCENRIVSAQVFNNSLSATLIEFGGAGHGYSSSIGINDSDSSVYIGFSYEKDSIINLSIKVELNYLSNHGEYYFYEPISPNKINISLNWNNTAVQFEINNYSETIPLYFIMDNSSYCNIITKSQYLYDTAFSSWDNIIGERQFIGHYLSDVHDCSYPKPMIKKYFWNETIQARNKISISLRSSDEKSMNNPSEWTLIKRDYPSPIMTVNRYLQYCVTFESEEGIFSPMLHDISFIYDKLPVKKVEISINNGANWSTATGINRWYYLTNLSENDNVILAKTIHYAGDYDIAIINVSVDTTNPTGSITINSNAQYTKTQEVMLQSNAFDKYGIRSMIVSEDPIFNRTDWIDYCSTRHFILSPGDGIKILFCKYKDNNDHISNVINDSIILDSTSPSSFIITLPTQFDTQKFLISWNGIDITSGMSYYDIQYRDTNGTWNDWIQKTNLTSAHFTGIDGHSYYFRVRAKDNVGNYEPYSSYGVGPFTVQLPKPLVNIIRPTDNSNLKRGDVIEGVSNHQNNNITIKQVQVRIDNESWQTANGTNNWRFNLTINKLTNGAHVIYARAFDGLNYSLEARVNITVSNLEATVTMDEAQIPFIMLVVFLIIIGLYFYLFWKKK